MKKEEIKTFALKEREEITQVMLRSTEIKKGRFEGNDAEGDMYKKNEWFFIESPSNKKQVLNGNDIILID